MHQRIVCLIFILVFLSMQIAHSSTGIHLKPGMNEVSIKVFNDINMDIENLTLLVKNEELPEGITVTIDKQKIHALAKKKSENSLQINIQVDENIPEGVYQIPICLTDGSHQSWDFVLTADLKLNRPEKYELTQNYPNPFNPETHIDYALPHAQEQLTRLVVYNTLGEQIRTLVDKKQSAGNYKVVWDGKDDTGNTVASGVYFYKITSGSFSQMKKMMLIK